MAEHNQTGAWGEQVAVDYLVAHGCAIVDRNVRMGNDEIDIIAMEGANLLFIEVKTRTDAAVDPATAVDGRKLQKICRFADRYVRQYGIEADPRIDVISVTGNAINGATRIDHIKDCYLPSTAPGKIPLIPLDTDD